MLLYFESCDHLFVCMHLRIGSSVVGQEKILLSSPSKFKYSHDMLISYPSLVDQHYQCTSNLTHTKVLHGGTICFQIFKLKGLAQLVVADVDRHLATHMQIITKLESTQVRHISPHRYCIHEYREAYCYIIFCLSYHQIHVLAGAVSFSLCKPNIIFKKHFQILYMTFPKKNKYVRECSQSFLRTTF